MCSALKLVDVTTSTFICQGLFAISFKTPLSPRSSILSARFFTVYRQLFHCGILFVFLLACFLRGWLRSWPDVLPEVIRCSHTAFASPHRYVRSSWLILTAFFILSIPSFSFPSTFFYFVRIGIIGVWLATSTISKYPYPSCVPISLALQLDVRQDDYQSVYRKPEFYWLSNIAHIAR